MIAMNDILVISIQIQFTYSIHLTSLDYYNSNKEKDSNVNTIKIDIKISIYNDKDLEYKIHSTKKRLLHRESKQMCVGKGDSH